MGGRDSRHGLGCFQLATRQPRLPASTPPQPRRQQPQARQARLRRRPTKGSQAGATPRQLPAAAAAPAPHTRHAGAAAAAATRWSSRPAPTPCPLPELPERCHPACPAASPAPASCVQLPEHYQPSACQPCAAASPAPASPAPACLTCSVRNWVYIWERLSSASSWLNLAWSRASCCCGEQRAGRRGGPRLGGGTARHQPQAHTTLPQCCAGCDGCAPAASSAPCCRAGVSPQRAGLRRRPPAAALPAPCAAAPPPPVPPLARRSAPPPPPGWSRLRRGPHWPRATARAAS